jgi:phenylalanyl-tRNA synthetase beta chain
MNILIPHSWLLEHLDTQATPEDIQKYVSLCGPSIERIYDKEGEPVYDIEVTTNRVDSMSVRGIAREVAVILEQFKIHASLKEKQVNDDVLRAKPTNSLPLPKIVNDPRLCKRVMCVILKDVKRTPTPDWMAKRLLQIDQNVHDSVIDITNYITHELGHPCHAFDYDKIMSLGGEIIVKEAQKGKTFITLDGNEYQTVGGEIVFENQKGEIIDLPAIKGTANSSINSETRNVLLWIESLDAKKVRFGSMTHAIRTVAAQLNEKNVDPELGEEVMLRGVELYRDLCRAQIASHLFDEYPGQRKPKTLSIQLDTIEQYLGIKLPTDQIQSILEKLECRAVVEAKTLLVTPPSFRPDLEIPADIVEEIARIYGYHNLPSVVMPTPIPLIRPAGINFVIENKIKHFLADIGWQEVYTYSMVDEALALQSGQSLEQHLKIQNPLTDDRVYLRRSLVPSLNEVLDQNPQRSELSVFEIANVYQPRAGDLPIEELHLTLVSSKPYRQVKGDLESLLQQFHVPLKSVDQKGTTGTFDLGTIQVQPSGRVVIDIKVADLLAVAKSHPRYQPIPKTATVIEDLTFTLPERTQIGNVIQAMSNASPLVTKVELHDVYQQNYTLTLTYHDATQNLTKEAVEPIRKQVIDRVSTDFSGQLVGNV